MTMAAAGPMMCGSRMADAARRVMDTTRVPRGKPGAAETVWYADRSDSGDGYRRHEVHAGGVRWRAHGAAGIARHGCGGRAGVDAGAARRDRAVVARGFDLREV